MISIRNPPDTLDLSPDVSVNSLIHWYPSLLPLLNELGIDTCCGGGESLERAAHSAQIPLGRLMGEVSTAVERTVALDAPPVAASIRTTAAGRPPRSTFERRRNR